MVPQSPILPPLTGEEDDAWEEEEAVTGDEMRCSSRRVIARGERRLRHELMTRPPPPRPHLTPKDEAVFRGGNIHFGFSIQVRVLTGQSSELDGYR